MFYVFKINFKNILAKASGSMGWMGSSPHGFKGHSKIFTYDH